MSILQALTGQLALLRYYLNGIAIQQRNPDRDYSSAACLFCGEVTYSTLKKQLVSPGDHDLHANFARLVKQNAVYGL